MSDWLIPRNERPVVHTRAEAWSKLIRALLIWAFVVTLGSSCLPAGAHAQSIPETLSVNEVYTWTAATRALTAGGDVALDVPVVLRDSLERHSARFEQSFGSAARHGLRDGDVPSRAFCAPSEFLTLPQTESRNQFDAALLLSEVAVVARIADVVPGFSGSGLPAALLLLADVEPLHERSPLPVYVVVPMGTLVVSDRVFCAPVDLGLAGYRPVGGSRIVVVGSWRGNATVPVGPGFQGLLAALEPDRESLRWLAGFGPATLAEMLGRVDEVVSAGLFRLTDHLAGLAPGSAERVRFGDQWVQDLIDTGCRVVGARKEVTGEFRLERTCREAEDRLVP